ncbi:hypothetical protein QAD02_010857 [Eretmocerus hayati]|uniref:Uncharacterized protein n=1 Tax=Eretmocerus hayati TaxID=131215 RepID=A0ACC2NWU3_9HYME|nr:hypothetical protein QAD02_010857 [Eretmocerus hayati]
MGSLKQDLIDFEIFSNAFLKKRMEVVDALIRQDFLKVKKYGNVATLLHCAVQHGEKEMTRFLASRKVSPDVKDYDGETPLHYAFFLEDSDMIDAILMNKCLSKRKPRLENPVDKLGLSHMHIACMNRNTCAELYVRKFIEKGIPTDVRVESNVQQWPGYTPLHFAAEFSNYRVAELLVKFNADINAQSSNGSTPLHIAFLKSLISMVEMFLTKIVSPENSNSDILNMTNNMGLSHLHIACAHGNLKFITRCINQGMDINIPVGSGTWGFSKFSPLHMAIHYQNYETLELLLSHGADMYAKEANNMTPLHSAFHLRSYRIIDILLSEKYLKTSANPADVWGLSFFHIACITNKVNLVRKFLKAGVCINDCIDHSSPYFPGYTALHLAVHYERLDIVRLLLESKADVMARDARERTALHIACTYDAARISDLFEQNHCLDVKGLVLVYELEEKHKEISTWFNDRSEHIEIIKLLIEHKSEVTAVDHYGRPPLYFAFIIYNDINEKFGISVLSGILGKLRSSRQAIVEILVENGADVHTVNKFTQETTLGHAILCPESFVFGRGTKDMVELLVKEGADVNQKYVNTYSPLHLAVTQENSAVVDVLIKYNANVNEVERGNKDLSLRSHGATPLHEAVARFNVEISTSLINAGANVNAKQLDGKTPLHLLVYTKIQDRNTFEIESMIEIMKCLLEAGSDIDAQDELGRTPLYLACSKMNCPAATRLIEFGADINIEDQSGKNPLSQCLFVNHGRFHEIYYPFDDHINKLKQIGQHVSSKNLKYFKHIRKKHSTSFDEESDQYLLKKYVEEFKKMRNKQINDRSLLSMLGAHINLLARYVNNKTFRKIIFSKNFKKKFPIFGYLLKIQYNRGCERLNLQKNAKESMETLTGVILPPVCSEKIMSYLSNESLKDIIAARTESILD